MKIVKKIFKWFFIILIVLNIAILASGRTYLYKGIWNTYLQGRSGPAIDEYTIFDNRVVTVSNYQPWAISPNYNKTKPDTTYLNYFQKYQSVAYLVIKNDSIVYEQYWDSFSDSSHTNSFSMGKTITSILAGIAIGEGKISSIDDPIVKYLPDYKYEGAEKITVKHLLTMSSGINFDEDYVNPLAYPAAAYYGTDLKKLTLSYKPTEEPGKVFKYLSGNTTLLGMVLEKATGMTLSDYASEKLWKKIGAQYPAYWSLDHKGGIEKAYCCFNSNARDFARFGKLYLDSGKWNGEQIVPQEYVLNSILPAHLVYDDDGAKNKKYGYSWWLVPDYKGHAVFYARGILGQYIIVIPDEKLIVVRLGKKREKPKGTEHPVDLFWYIDAAMQIIKK